MDSTSSTAASHERRSRLSIAEISTAIVGRHLDITRDVAGIPAELLDGRHHPCPKCGGTDRFRLIDSDKGAVICNQCFASDNGDSIAAVRWMRGASFPEALQLIGEYLGVAATSNGHRQQRDIVAEVAQAKRMPLEAFKLFGAETAKRGKLTVARVPVFDDRGERCTEFDLTPDGKGWFKKGGGSGVFLPGRKPEAGETWLLVEGVKDAAALVGLGYHAMGMPTCKLRSDFAALLRECHVVLVPDLDTAGQDGAGITASRLTGIAASVRVARLPGEITASNGSDVRDVLHLADGERLLRESIEGAKTWEMPTPDGSDDERPEIELSYDESRVVADVLPVIGNLGWRLKPEAEHLRTYQRSGELFHVVTDAAPVADIAMPDDARRIRPLPSSLLRERVTAACRLYIDVVTDHGLERQYKRPPDWLVKMMHERGQYPREWIKPITGVVTSPTVRPDGSIVQRSGYDERTGLLVEITGTWPAVPERPTRDDAIRAAGELLNVVVDFPFVSAAHRSGWLALVLSLVGRPAISGTVPLFLIDANTRGSGKTLGADAAGIIATGKRLPRKTWPGDDDEIRKTITAVALEALPVVLLDNIVGRLGSGSLDAALTGTTWSDRILGQSKTTGTLPLTTVWVASGNNVELAADTARRTLLLRLESDLENPEERSGFTHPDLLAWVTTERRRLVVAVLTMLRAYVVAGRPDQQLPPWGSFEAWSSLVRNAIVWAGLPDPAETRQIVRAQDQSAELLRLLLTAIEETGEATAAELVRLATAPVGPDQKDKYPILRAVVADLCGDKITAPRLGARLRSYVHRICGGRRLVKRPGRGGVTVWATEAAFGGHGGHGGHAQHSPYARDESIHPDHPGGADTAERCPEGPETCQPSQPCQPSPPDCNHRDPETFIHRDGSAYCRGCDKWLGRLKAATA